MKTSILGEVNKSPLKSSFLTEMQPSAEKLWNAAQEHLRTTLSPDIYKMWFSSLRASELEGNHITLEVADEFYQIWLKDNYLGILQDALAIPAGRRLQVKFKINGQITPPPTATPPAPTRIAKVVEQAERNNNHNDLILNPRNTFDSFV